MSFRDLPSKGGANVALSRCMLSPPMADIVARYGASRTNPHSRPRPSGQQPPPGRHTRVNEGILCLVKSAYRC